MLCDAHCHPFDLERIFPGAEEERRRLGIFCAASAADPGEFEYNEGLAAAGPPLLCCYAVHPQLPAARGNCSESLDALDALARAGRLDAVGETGFDLYNAAFRLTEKLQDELFTLHLETALRYGLPLVLHVRRAMHKVFARAADLKKCRALIFHSWPGTAGEGEALLRRGINAFFSFGTAILLNHREAIRCCAAFPAERVLSETDAPFQALRGRACSTWGDLPAVLGAMAELRGGAKPAELEGQIEKNFRGAFCGGKD
ncbi:MAG: TatD family hydrolase [Treponema sp.]|jgi:TatD DNase family protein|nr:TatD family hydrolase [Treponema sp.]